MKRRKDELGFMQVVLDLAKLRGWRRAHFRTVCVRRKDGSYYYETPVQADGKGFLDLVLLRRGTVLIVELKEDGGKLTPEQEAWAEAWREAGVRVEVWRPSDWQKIQDALELL